MRKVQAILAQDTGRNPRKAIIFLSYIPTGNRLCSLLGEAGIRTAFYQGGLDEHQRRRLIDRPWGRVEDRHRDDADRGEISALLATDAGGVGLNLQVANHVINYDLSWNPMIVEQRVGRVHRLGQRRKHVFVENFFAKTFGDEQDRVLSIEENLHTSLNTKVALIQQLGIELSDSELAEAELRFRTRTISEEQYRRIVERVVSRKAEELKRLSDLKSLVSVTDETERERAVQQSHIFDRYCAEMLDLLEERYSERVTRHGDGSVTVISSADLPLDDAIAGTERRRLTIDRDEAERSGDRIEFFGVRHPWMRALTRKILDAESPLVEAKEVRLDQIADIALDSERVIRMDELGDMVGESLIAWQLNFLITHRLRRGDEELDPVARLFSLILFDDDRHSTDEVLGAKLNLTPATTVPRAEPLLDEIVARARTLAESELDRIVGEVNQANQSDLAIRHSFQAGKQTSDQASLIEEMRDLRDRIIPKLKQGQPIAGFSTVEEAEAHQAELSNRLQGLHQQGTLLTEQQQFAFERARHVKVEKFPPQLVSCCRYEFLRGDQ